MLKSVRKLIGYAAACLGPTVFVGGALSIAYMVGYAVCSLDRIERDTRQMAHDLKVMSKDLCGIVSSMHQESSP